MPVVAGSGGGRNGSLRMDHRVRLDVRIGGLGSAACSFASSNRQHWRLTQKSSPGMVHQSVRSVLNATVGSTSRGPDVVDDESVLVGIDHGVGSQPMDVGIVVFLQL